MKRATIACLVCGLAATAGATTEPSESRIGIEPEAGGGLRAKVEGFPRPDAHDVLVYPEGHPGQGVHPHWMAPSGAADRSISLAIVYQASSSELVANLALAFQDLHINYILSRDSEVSVVDYGQMIEVRMGRLNPAYLSRLTFEGSAIGTEADRESALRQAGFLLEHSPLKRRMLILISDGCDADRDSDPVFGELARQNVELYEFKVDAMTKCRRRSPRGSQAMHVRTERLGDALRSLMLEVTGTRWSALFDASWLGEQTGARRIVLDIAGREPVTAVVFFPSPNVLPSWFSSRLRQLGLGALVIGLIALFVRSTRGRRSPESVT